MRIEAVKRTIYWQLSIQYKHLENLSWWMEYCRMISAMNARLCKIWIWMRPEDQILISSNQNQLANWAILTVLSMLTFYINTGSALRDWNSLGGPFSHLYPVSSVVFDHWIWPADGGIVVRIKKNFVSNLEHEEGGRREEGGGESFTGYSNWEGIRMPLPSLLTPPTTIKKLKPKLFFVIQDQTV